MEARIDDVSLGTNTQEDHLLLSVNASLFVRKTMTESNSKNASS